MRKMQKDAIFCHRVIGSIIYDVRSWKKLKWAVLTGSYVMASSGGPIHILACANIKTHKGPPEYSKPNDP